MKRVEIVELGRQLDRHQNWLASIVREAAAAEDRLSMEEVSINGWVLHGSNLCEVEFIRCLITDSHFANCDFSYSLCVNSVFRQCSFLDCDFRKADLRSADLSGADLSGSDLTRCDLTDANLRAANLSNCSLDGAWLVGADLRGAVLDGARFVGTRFIGTKLYEAGGRGISSFKDAIVEDVDLSPDASGEQLLGAEALDLLHRK